MCVYEYTNKTVSSTDIYKKYRVYKPMNSHVCVCKYTVMYIFIYD